MYIIAILLMEYEYFNFPCYTAMHCPRAQWAKRKPTVPVGLVCVALPFFLSTPHSPFFAPLSLHLHLETVFLMWQPNNTKTTTGSCFSKLTVNKDHNAQEENHNMKEKYQDKTYP